MKKVIFCNLSKRIIFVTLFKAVLAFLISEGFPFKVVVFNPP